MKLDLHTKTIQEENRTIKKDIKQLLNEARVAELD